MLLLVANLLVAVAYASSSTQCERAPTHAQPADAHYRLAVAGEPDQFLPGELYTVSLEGEDNGQGPTPFVGFTIWAEISNEYSKEGSEEVSTPTAQYSKYSLGAFQSYDAQTKILESCAPAVDNATGHPKTEVQVIWNAPSSNEETCVRLCARVGPVVGANTWSVLARKMCPTSAAPTSFTRQPPIVEPCCACDEAKYEISHLIVSDHDRPRTFITPGVGDSPPWEGENGEGLPGIALYRLNAVVTFEGLWSRNTHPREFPPESARAHFGDLIGASHTAQYRVWQEGRVASTGLRRLADDGATTALEKELKAESEHIRTIIKARGISWQQVAGAGNPSTFAVFRVDAKHHLVSLAAKLAPSPDWIVGVSALELCNANCTWRRSATLPLYPYDAGTDSGISYTSRRIPTIPSVPVRALRPDWPRDVRSPFFSSTRDMRPFARLRLNRLRLYEKSCDASESSADKMPETGGIAGACATHTWGVWGPCSATCGPGRATRQRHYMWPHRAYSEACRMPLTDYKYCRGLRMYCRAPSEYEPEPASRTGPCAVSAWGAWSPCEGCGVRARTRHYLAPRAHKRCHIGYRARTLMSQAMPCDAGPCYKPTGNFTNSSTFDWFFVDKPGSGDCTVTAWGDWSPCSARCGRGRRLRTRVYVSRDSRVQRQLSRTLLHQWNRRFAQLQSLEYPVENITAEDPEVERLVQEHLEQCQFTLTQQEALCDGEEGSCLGDSVSQEICKLPVSVGHCRGYEERWFYDESRGSCEPFGFTGCGGNRNNFRTMEHCVRACLATRTNQTIHSVGVVSNDTNAKKFKPTPSTNDNEVMQNDTPSLQADAVECAMGPWLGWGNCFGDCDFALKLNYRLILRPGSGRSCRRLVKSRICKPTPCRKILSDTTTGSTVDTIDPLNGNNFNYDYDDVLKALS